MFRTEFRDLCSETGIFNHIAKIIHLTELPPRSFFPEFLKHFEHGLVDDPCLPSILSTTTFPEILTPSTLHDKLALHFDEYADFLKRMGGNELAVDPYSLFIDSKSRQSRRRSVLLGFVTVDSSVPPVYSLADDSISLPILIPSTTKLPPNLNDLLYIPGFSVVVDSLSSYRSSGFSPFRSLSLALEELDRIPIANHKEFVSQFSLSAIGTQARIRGEFLFSQPPDFLKNMKKTPNGSAKPFQRPILSVSMAKICSLPEFNSQSVVTLRGRVSARHFEMQDNLL